MSTIKEEIHSYISVLPDSALIALKPILTLLVSEESAFEIDLSDEEKDIIIRGREEYLKGAYVPLSDIR